MKQRPLKDRILVKPESPEEKTEGGIIIPDSAKQTQQKGTVVAIGDSVESVSTKDTVVYGKTSGIEINLEGEDYLIMREDDVLFIET